MRLSDLERQQTRVPRFLPDLSEESEVLQSLERLFRNRCAFCEAEVPLKPYHFRPVGEAWPARNDGQAHLYYAWLETAWENLYPICGSCTPKDSLFFPVIGHRCSLPSIEDVQRFTDENSGLWRHHPPHENAKFLDPCSTNNFHTKLKPLLDGTLEPLSLRGEATIEQFNLNALERKEARARRYAQYLSELGASLRHADHLVFDRILSFQKLEFGGTWHLLLRRLVQAMVRQRDVTAKPGLTPIRIRGFLNSKMGTWDAMASLEAALTSLRLEDETSIIERSRTQGSRWDGHASLVAVNLSNFKAIEALSLELPKTILNSEHSTPDQPVPSLLILGDNSAGKSSVLEAIALALAEEPARRQVKNTQQWALNPAYLGSTTNSSRAAHVELKLSNGGQRSLTIEGPNCEVSQTDNWNNVPVFAYGAFRHYRNGQRVRSPDAYIRSLFHGNDTPNPEQWLLKLADDRFNMVIRALREILSIEGDFEVVERDFEKKTCYIVTSISGTEHRVKTPLRIVSSGFRSVLAMACDVMHGLINRQINRNFESLTTARGVVLIDEVEAHLHPRWKMQIMRGLRRALPRITFIATTHDPLCLRGMNDGEVAMLQRVPREQASRATELPVTVEWLVDLPSVSQLRVDQLLTSDLFQLNSTDAPEMDQRLAKIGDLLARDPATLQEADRSAISQFQRDLIDALPIGSTEVHRVAQEAVAEYLKARREVSAARMRELKEGAKSRIVRALEGMRNAQG
ncbi:MAG: AAA family ATPase [Zoogloea sp.]|nr:AAA family ATPase [Zoogloea sp.]MCA0184561.1 AAA family ATPase [Pseudomonadota bacterium]